VGHHTDSKRQELEAARNMEADCTIGAGAGFGRYTREVAEQARERGRQLVAEIGRPLNPLRVSIALRVGVEQAITPSMAPKKKTETQDPTAPAQDAQDTTPKRTIVRAKTALDWNRLLSTKHEEHWRTLRVVIQIREKLYAGKPASLKAADAMLKARGLDEFVAEAVDIVDPVERAAAAEEIAETAGLCEFSRRDNKPGIWIPSNNVKAGFKENHQVLGYRVAVRGSRGALAEGIFVAGIDGDSDWIYLGEKPDGIDTSVTHSEGPKGPVTAIKRNEYVIRPKITFDVMIANAKAVADKISDDELADVLVHYGEHGLGANRSQGNGKFDVVSVAELERSPRST